MSSNRLFVEAHRGQAAEIAQAIRDLAGKPSHQLEYERAVSLRKRLIAAYNAAGTLTPEDEAELAALGAKPDPTVSRERLYYALAEVVDRAAPKATAKSRFTLANVDERLAALRARPNQDDAETRREIEYLVALRARKFPRAQA